MTRRIALALAAGMLVFSIATGQPVGTYKVAMVALMEDSLERAEFEEGLAAKFRKHDYDAVTSYDIIPEVTDLAGADVVRRLAEAGIEAVIMMKPAAVGPGSSLESVRDDVSNETYASMRDFAREISPSGDEDLVAVIHTAIYVIGDDETELLSSGAVWLDEPVETREEGIDKLQNLIVTNMNQARPAIRQYLGLPPLPQN